MRHHSGWSRDSLCTDHTHSEQYRLAQRSYRRHWYNVSTNTFAKSAVVAVTRRYYTASASRHNACIVSVSSAERMQTATFCRVLSPRLRPTSYRRSHWSLNTVAGWPRAAAPAKPVYVGPSDSSSTVVEWRQRDDKNSSCSRHRGDVHHNLAVITTDRLQQLGTAAVSAERPMCSLVITINQLSLVTAQSR